jgi:hypothetical protein
MLSPSPGSRLKIRLASNKISLFGHTKTVYQQEVSCWMYKWPIGTHFGKLPGISLTRANVVGSQLSSQARVG